MEKKLLILTQKIDASDPILGFFHSWIEKLSQQAFSITVICLERGITNLPSNVEILSLGKETGRSRLKYLRRLYSAAISRRSDYDTVFVHMNQEYVLLCGLIWKFLGKKVLMWRNHRSGTLLTRIAVALSDKVFCTSPESYTARFKKTKIMPAGIDTDLFRRGGKDPEKGSVLYVGRISPIKRLEVLVSALEKLRESGTSIRALFVGDPPPDGERYYSDIRAKAAALEEAGQVSFRKAVVQSELPELYASHEIFVNMTEQGSFDKTVVEAMACECLPIVSNPAFSREFPHEARNLLTFSEGDSDGLALKIQSVLALSLEKKKELGRLMREIAVGRHSLNRLVNELMQEL